VGGSASCESKRIESPEGKGQSGVLKSSGGKKYLPSTKSQGRRGLTGGHNRREPKVNRSREGQQKKEGYKLLVGRGGPKTRVSHSNKNARGRNRNCRCENGGSAVAERAKTKGRRLQLKKSSCGSNHRSNLHGADAQMGQQVPRTFLRQENEKVGILQKAESYQALRGKKKRTPGRSGS